MFFSKRVRESPAFKDACCIIAVISCCRLSVAKTDLAVFLFSGQSNMVGLGQVSELPENLKHTQDNALIHLDAEGDESKRGQWLNLGPGFGTNAGSFGPEVSFGKTVLDSFPDMTIAIIKDAVSGTSLAQSSGGGWMSNGGWRPPSSDGETGTLYTDMMSHIDEALASLDTTVYEPRFVGFVWLQGEADAMSATEANEYETNLRNLISDIREKTGVEDLPVILPMIDVQNIWTHSAVVRGAEVAVAQSMTNVDTFDTRGYETDGIHYKASGQVTIGTIAAQKWVAMANRFAVPANDWRKNRRVHISSSNQALSGVVAYDVLGRMIGRSPSLQGALKSKNVASQVLVTGRMNEDSERIENYRTRVCK